MDFTADLDAFYADFGVPAVRTPSGGGSASAPMLVILDLPGVVVLGGDVIATDYALRYRATSFSGVRRGDVFEIGGVTYSAREAGQATLDGLECTVPLARG
ncbi:MAG: hypothetical protein H6948_16135 [Zoogloeaceae bacterium]|nr:hypothetical protein [Rhodocyclaceae bacterium]MCP5233580.1 hypothetical protein [Zoogloeaceae bacterium]